ncbi:MAG: Tat pathway signal protein [Acetobacter indonesiensis]|nr:Tat pathway signal protein [Acetobacter indonesiensis]MCI1546912.1 Tat pathway signal protein [Acetobacter indonesiensis]MCI1766250.1 Tat pathway signal protein [Acetobacter indonesiensis]
MATLDMMDKRFSVQSCLRQMVRCVSRPIPTLGAVLSVSAVGVSSIGGGVGCSAAYAADGGVPNTPTVTRAAHSAAGPYVVTASDKALLEDLEHRTFLWFWEAGDPKTGLVPDRYPSDQTQASVASIGFGLTAYGIGADRGYITHAQAVERTLITLRYLSRLPQNASADKASGYHGFFYHFLDHKTGLRFNKDIELSSIDTALLMQGVLFTESYYTANTPQEREIRTLANALYQGVDWAWMRRPDQRLSMGWSPEHQFLPNYWEGYSEGMMAYVLGLGASTHPLQPASWQAWLATNDKRWGEYSGQTLLNFAPLFGHQYTHSWIDFRGIQDDWNREKGIDYFENSRRAAYAQRSYAIANPGKWQDYGPDVWGLTASDGPGEVTETENGQVRRFFSYSARGAGRDYTQDDGTIAPTAAGGSVAFAPEIAVPALREMKHRYGSHIYGRYGFVDAFNPSFHNKTTLPFWSDTAYLGIDQGPILLMLENRRSGFVWNVMKKNPAIRLGLERAGFRGGWLGNTEASTDDNKGVVRNNQAG